MEELMVQIVRFVDDAFPGFVECQFCDAHGRFHSFIEKVPVVSNEMLDSGSTYPRRATARCTILSRGVDKTGREIVRISTTTPDCIESTEGLSEFEVPADAVVPTAL